MCFKNSNFNFLIVIFDEYFFKFDSFCENCNNKTSDLILVYTSAFCIEASNF